LWTATAFNEASALVASLANVTEESVGVLSLVSLESFVPAAIGSVELAGAVESFTTPLVVVDASLVLPPPGMVTTVLLAPESSVTVTPAPTKFKVPLAVTEVPSS
jgi:hypothetical protein